MNNNHNKPWGAIEEVKADEIPGIAGRTLWFELFQDITLRLEKTTRSKALVIPFEDDVMAQRAGSALRRYAQEYQVDIDICTRKSLNGGRNTYVRRGEKWGK